MRVATWNVNNIRKRLPQLLAWLDATKPDVVALQELKTETSAFPRAELETAGYSCVVAGQRTWNGVALLSRGLRAHRNSQNVAWGRLGQAGPLPGSRYQRGGGGLPVLAEWQPAAPAPSSTTSWPGSSA